MKMTLAILTVAATLAAGSALAQSDVLKAKGCMNCHDIDKKKAGPSLKDIAAKYKDPKAATPTLVAKLKDGKGHPKISASDAELNAAVAAVLATK